MFERIDQLFRRLNRLLGRLLVLVLLLMSANVFFDVIMRYFFHNSTVGMQEMEWHLFSFLLLFAISFTLIDEAHVRVDFIYQRYSMKTKALVNIIGTVLFLVPLALLIIFGSLEFVYDAWSLGEISDDPGGLPCRWVVKAMIPLSFALLLLFSIGYLAQNINIYRTAVADSKVIK